MDTKVETELAKIAADVSSHVVLWEPNYWFLTPTDAVDLLSKLAHLGVAADTLGTWKYADKRIKEPDKVIEVPHISYDVPVTAVGANDANSHAIQFIRVNITDNANSEVDLIEIVLKDHEAAQYLHTLFRDLRNV